MSDEILLCINCAHFRPQGEFCGRTFRPDYIRGDHKHFYAKVERDALGPDSCGPNARFFDPLPDSSISAIPVKQVA